MSRKFCKCDDLEILEKSNVLQLDHNGYPLRLCLCKCKTCGRTSQKWLDESLGKAQEELKNGISVLCEWNYGENKTSNNEGWVCPRCGRVNAPSNTHCVCKPINEKECKHDWMLEASLIGENVQTNYYKCKNCGKTRIGYIEKI